uniref:Uncharacterized protein n=1 Tax=Panagrolaimus davidi TaxID=227884 RepID=A0A914QM31_9BILA
MCNYFKTLLLLLCFIEYSNQKLMMGNHRKIPPYYDSEFADDENEKDFDKLFQKEKLQKPKLKNSAEDVAPENQEMDGSKLEKYLKQYEKLQKPKFKDSKNEEVIEKTTPKIKSGWEWEKLDYDNDDEILNGNKNVNGRYYPGISPHIKNKNNNQKIDNKSNSNFVTKFNSSFCLIIFSLFFI